MTAKYRRILLKISGESLCSSGKSGIDGNAILSLAEKIKHVHDEGVQLVVVVGGGNYVRGAGLKVSSIQPATADYMGMLATVMNAIALQDTCETIGLETRVLSAISINRICEPWIRRRAVRHIEKGRVVILAAGTGNPHFTTDTAAAQRALEIGCDVLIKATKVDGVYDSDPVKNASATRYDRLDYLDCINRDLRVMDATAITLCKEHGLPIIVMSIDSADEILAAIRGERVGTYVGNIVK
ncbi:MAG: UMP kinase [Planctomycetaceae bacterium]|nr:UMP kinase [Planctomycetaceae bacterium]